MSFEEYLRDRKIDSDAFRRDKPEQWENLRNLFEQVHPNSFTAQKKFIINDIRRKYHLQEE